MSNSIKAGDKYYFIASCDFSILEAIWYGSPMQLAQAEVGNVFLTEEEAQNTLAKILNILPKHLS